MDTNPTTGRRSAAHLTVPAKKPSAAPLTAPRNKPSAAPTRPNPSTGSRSAPNITVSTSEPSVAPKSDSSAMFARLQRLIDDCGPNRNKHHLVIVLITACITEGVDTGSRIIGALVHLGFNNRHVAMLLKEGTGANPELHRWRKGQDGRYSLLG
jgi:hypothetical protein